jgi:hypothetical protein
MTTEDRVTLGFVAVVCVIGAAALAAYGHDSLCIGIAALGGSAWHVATRRDVEERR